MSNFFKSLFGGKADEAAAGGNNGKNFEIFKYDGLRAQRMGRVDYAVKCFNEALKIDEDFETMGYLSQLYVSTGELDKAHGLMLRMMELEPQLPEIYISLANLCYMESKYDEMKEVAQKAIETDSGNAVAYYLLAKAMKETGDDIMGIANTTKAIVLKNDFAEARLLRAEILMRMGQYTEAAEDIDFVLGETPDDENAMLFDARLKAAEDKAEEAERSYRRVIDADPFNEQAFVELGQLYISMKRLDEAILLFDEAIELNPDFSKAYYERGRARLLNGDKEGAMADSKKAMELQPKAGENLTGSFNNSDAEQRINILGI